MLTKFVPQQRAWKVGDRAILVGPHLGNCNGHKVGPTLCGVHRVVEVTTRGVVKVRVGNYKTLSTFNLSDSTARGGDFCSFGIVTEAEAIAQREAHRAGTGESYMWLDETASELGVGHGDF